MKKILIILIIVSSFELKGQEVITNFRDGVESTKFLLTSIDKEPHAVGLDVTGKIFIYRFDDDGSPILLQESGVKQNMVSQNFIVRDHIVYLNRKEKLWVYNVFSNIFEEYTLATCEGNDIVFDDLSTGDNLLFYAFEDCSTVSSTLFALNNQSIHSLTNEIDDVIRYDEDYIIGLQKGEGANISNLVFFNQELQLIVENDQKVDERLRPVVIQDDLYYVDEQDRFVKWSILEGLVTPLVEDIQLSDLCRFDFSYDKMKIISMDEEGDYIDIYTMNIEEGSSDFFSVSAIQDYFKFGSEVLIDSIWYFITKKGNLLAYQTDEAIVELSLSSGLYNSVVSYNNGSILLQGENQVWSYDLSQDTHIPKGQIPLASENRFDFIPLADQMLFCFSSSFSKYKTTATLVDLTNEDSNFSYPVEGINLGGVFDIDYRSVKEGFEIEYRDSSYFINDAGVFNISSPYAFSDFSRTYQIGEDFYGLNIKNSGAIDIYYGNKTEDVEYKFTIPDFLNVTFTLVGLDHLIFRSTNHQAYVYSKELNGLFFISIPSGGLLEFTEFEGKRMILAVPRNFYVFDEEWESVNAPNVSGSIYKLAQDDGELFGLGTTISTLKQDSFFVIKDDAFDLEIFENPAVNIRTKDYYLSNRFNSFKVYQPHISSDVLGTLRLRVSERNVLQDSNSVLFRDFALGVPSYHLVNITNDTIYRKDLTFSKDGTFGEVFDMAVAGNFVYIVVNYNELDLMKIFKYDLTITNRVEIAAVYDNETQHRKGHAYRQGDRFIIPFGQSIYTFNFKKEQTHINPNVRLANDGSRIYVDDEYLYYVGLSDASGRQLMRINNTVFATQVLDNTMKNLDMVTYPNPCTNVLNISEEHHGDYYKIIGMDGNVVVEGNCNTNRINIDALTSGQYIFFLMNDKETLQSKFIKI